MGVKIAIADDHHLIKDGLRKVIDDLESFDMVGTAASGSELLSLVEETRPDVVIVDIRMPEMNGLDATRIIHERYPGTKILILSMYAERQYVVESFKAGASGYLLKESPSGDIVEAIQTVMDGGMYTSPRVTEIMQEAYVRNLKGEETAPAAALTNRERQILTLLTEGMSTKKIASTLFISVSTVEVHRKNIMDKLQIRNLVDLTKFAIREGMATL
jgi:DNA-binding NarL/FixJ family response regulator